MIYLYLKTHNKTGLKYLGKTIRDPNIYHGSGLYWKRHLKEHGLNINTQILLATDDKDEFKETAIFFSRLFNIVKSKEWANFREETGHGGFSKEDALRGHINGKHKRSLAGGKAAVLAGKTWTSETAKIAGQKGGLAPNKPRKPLSEKHKESIRDGVNKSITNETREKISKAALLRSKRSFSKEAQINISISMKESWNRRKMLEMENGDPERS
jgi:hypothetical protein